MSKLDRLAGQWVKDGLYGSPDEAAQTVEQVMAEYHAQQQKRADELGKRIVQGYRDIAEGRLLASTGDYEQDKALFAEREANGWK